ncbi:major facilitator superfamily domain-containing protein [Dipodascopsis uninucleata]
MSVEEVPISATVAMNRSADVESAVIDEDIEDATAPLLPSDTRATLPNPFESRRSSDSSSFSISLTSSTRGIAPSASSINGQTELSNAHLITVCSSLYIGVFLSALDGTIVATLLAHMASDFSSFQNVSWIATAYLIACAAFQPLYGRLTDIFGRKPGLLFSNIMFGIGCLGCGLATNFWFLVFSRVVSGIGGGGLNALATITLSDLIPLRKRGVLQGFSNIMYGTGAALGGIFGGSVTAYFGWRWAFLLQVPFIVMSTLVIFFVLNLPIKPVGYESDIAAEYAREERLLKRVDFAGAFTLVLSLVLFLFAVSIGGNQVPWTSPIVLITLPLSALIMVLFAYIELKVASEPIIPVMLLKDRTVFGAAFTNWFMTMAVYSLLFFIPLYFVSVRDASETEAGISLISNFIGVAAGSFGSGVYMRNTGRYYSLSVSLAVVFIIGCGLICTFGFLTPIFTVLFYTLFIGVSYGALLTITLIALIAAVPQKYQAVTTSIQYAFRGAGSTLGVALSTSLFQNVLYSALKTRIIGSDAEDLISRIMKNLGEVTTAPSFLRPAIRESYLEASRAVFVLCFVLAVATGGTTLLMREHLLHSTLDRR